MNLSSIDSKLCPSCGSGSIEAFCAHCGERMLTTGQRKFQAIIADVFQELTTIDGKLWRTLRMLLLQPGALDRNFHVGRRVNYFKPLTLFLLVNIVYVTLSPLTDFYVNFIDQLTLQPYSGWVKPFVVERADSIGLTLAEFGSKYDQLVTVVARSLIIIQVPFFAFFASWVLYSRRYYSGDHFTFTLNMHSWLLLWVIIAQIPAYFIEKLLELMGLQLGAGVYFLLLPLGLIGYLLVAIRRLYDFPWWRVALSVVMLLAIYRLSHTLYRFCQLVITAAIVEA